MTPDLALLLTFTLGAVTGWLARWAWSELKHHNKTFDAWVRRIR